MLDRNVTYYLDEIRSINVNLVLTKDDYWIWHEIKSVHKQPILTIF
jgi:hypothetical protein